MTLPLPFNPSRRALLGVSATAFGLPLLGRGAQGQPSATAEDGIRSLAMALAAMEAAETGREVTVKTGL